MKVLIDTDGDMAIVDRSQLVDALAHSDWRQTSPRHWVQPDTADAYSLLCADLVPDATSHDTDWAEPSNMARFSPIDHGTTWLLEPDQ